MDKEGLRQLTVEKLAQGLQSGPGNEMAGIEGRAQLLIRLGRAMENREFFGEDGRPGSMLGRFPFRKLPYDAFSDPKTQAISSRIRQHKLRAS